MQIVSQRTRGRDTNFGNRMTTEGEQRREAMRIREAFGECNPDLKLRQWGRRLKTLEQCRYGVLPRLAQNAELKDAHDRRPRVQRVEHVPEEPVVADARYADAG